MLNHKNMKNYAMILASVMGLMNSSPNTNLTSFATPALNNRTANYFISLKDLSSNFKGNRGQLRLFYEIAQTSSPKFDNIRKLFSSRKNNSSYGDDFIDSIATYMIKCNSIAKYIPGGDVVALAGNGFEQNSVQTSLYVRRALISGTDLDSVITDTRPDQRDKNNVYSVTADGQLEMKSASIAAAVYAEVSSTQKHCLLHCSESSISAIIREVMKEGMQVRVSSLVNKLCAEEITPEILQQESNAFSLTKSSLIDTLALFLENAKKATDIQNLVTSFTGNDPLRVLRAELTDLLGGMKIRSRDFTLIFRMKDGVVYVGVVPLFNTILQDVVDQVDERGLLDSNKMKDSILKIKFKRSQATDSFSPF